MLSLDAHKAGGRIMAVRQREAALKAYYDNPSICAFCGAIIKVPEGGKIPQTRAKKYCNHSCAMKGQGPRPKIARKSTTCSKCGCVFDLKRGLADQFLKRRVCDACNRSMLTKGEIFANYPVHSAHSLIRSHARITTQSKGRGLTCMVCGYAKHVEVCHRKPVSKFSADTMLTTINDLGNLVVLCRNHHWEFDHKLLDAESLAKLNSCGGRS